MYKFIKYFLHQRDFRFSIRNLTVILVSCIVLMINHAIAQTTIAEFRDYFTNRLGSLERYEGLFRISLKIEPSLEHKYCIYNAYNSENFDIVAIYRKDNIVNVYSLNKKQIVGSISVNKKPIDWLFVKFNGNGTKDYLGYSEKSGAQVVCDYTNNNTYFTLSSGTFNINIKNIYDAFSYEIATRVNMKCAYYDETVILGSMYSIQQNAYRIFPDEYVEPDKESVKKGTGVIISANGYILTNFHVVDKIPKLNWTNCNWELNKIQNLFGVTADDPEGYFRYNLERVSQQVTCITGNKEYKLGIVDLNPDEDWALLKIMDSSFKTMNFAILDTQASILGTEVYTLGFPIAGLYGNDVKYTNGYISSASSNLEYGLNMGLNPGNSGGGVFNKINGHLIGIVKSRFNSKATGFDIEGISIALKLNDFARKIKNQKLFYTYSKDGWLTTPHASPKPGIFIVDEKYNPLISQTRSIASTVQIVVH